MVLYRTEDDSVTVSALIRFLKQVNERKKWLLQKLQQPPSMAL